MDLLRHEQQPKGPHVNHKKHAAVVRKRWHKVIAIGYSFKPTEQMVTVIQTYMVATAIQYMSGIVADCSRYVGGEISPCAAELRDSIKVFSNNLFDSCVLTDITPPPPKKHVSLSKSVVVSEG